MPVTAELVRPRSGLGNLLARLVEFAVNDGGVASTRIWQAMEGVVRQTWTANPRTDICFVYTFRVGYETDLGQGLCPPTASAMELLVEHYAIPSITRPVWPCHGLPITGRRPKWWR